MQFRYKRLKNSRISGAMFISKGAPFVFGLLIVMIFMWAGNATAQNKEIPSRIIGKIIDGENGEEIIGANIYLEGTTIGAGSDLDGTFMIENVPPGNYTLIVQMIGYRTLKLTHVEIKGGETKKFNLTLKPETLTTEEVVVEAKLMLNNEASLLKQRQKAAAVSDAISAEAFAKSGSGNAAEAMKLVTGASVMNGKYVLVRGLGERYSSTQLNGAELPTADPDKRSFQFDLIPTALLENIVTIKTFTPDQPGNFSGGIVNIGTKSYPESFMVDFSSTASYLSETTFNENFLSTARSSRDWLGMDSGLRNLPSLLSNPGTVIPSEIEARTNPEAARKLDQISKSFNPEMSPITRTAPFNQSYSLSIGNRIALFNRPLGYLVSLSYKSQANFYENGEVGRWKLTGKAANNDSLTNLIDLKDTRGVEKILWGGLATLTYKPHPLHEFSANLIYTQSGENEARYLVGKWPEQFLDNPNAFFETRALHYTQRNLKTYQLKGRHVFPAFGNMEFDWNAMFGLTRQDEPDVRFFSDNFAVRQFQGRDTVLYSISPAIYQLPARYFRNLNETMRNINFKLNFPFKQWQGLPGKLAIGGYFQDKDRQFRERLFEYRQGSAIRYNGNPGEFFSNNNIGIIGKDTLRNRFIFGNFIQESLNNALGGDYNGYERIRAAFLMFDIPVTRRLRMVGGIRYESTVLRVSDSDTTGKLDDRDWLPSINLVYHFGNNVNFRLAYGRTLARPNFREKAPYASYVFMNDVIFQGNIGLRRTLINNYDLRMEWFPRPGEILAISAFYKTFRNPIERVINLLYASEGAIVKYENVDFARVYGMEFEVRKQLDQLYKPLRNFFLGSNLSIVRSRVDIPSDELRLLKALDPEAKTYRPLQGQSPYILNIELGYNNPSTGTDIGIHYNVFGERLAEVSLGGTPNVFEQPRPMLDFSLSQHIAGGLYLNLNARNILDSRFRTVHHYKGYEYVRQDYRLGRTYSVGLKYSL